MKINKKERWATQMRPPISPQTKAMEEILNLNPPNAGSNPTGWVNLLPKVLIAVAIVGTVWLLVSRQKEIRKGEVLEANLETLKKAVENQPFTFISALDSLWLEAYTIYRFDIERAEWQVETVDRSAKLPIRSGEPTRLLSRGQAVKGIFAVINIKDPKSGFKEILTLCPKVGDAEIYLPFSDSFRTAYYNYRK